MRLYLVRDFSRVFKKFISKGIQIEGWGFVGLVRLKDENEPIFFVIAQGIACFHADIRPHGIVKLSDFDRILDNTRIHNSLIVQYSGCRPEVENQPNLT